MTRALIPKLTAKEGKALRRAAVWEGKQQRSDIIGSEDGRVAYYIEGGNDPMDLWLNLKARELVQLKNALFETYGFAGDTPRKLYQVRLTDRGRAALVVFDLSHDELGRPLRRRA